MSDRISRHVLLEEGYRWLFRGVFLLSPEQDWMAEDDEVLPPRPDRIGDYWRHQHINDATDTGYTSWSTNRDTAHMFAEQASSDTDSRGRVVVFRVLVRTLANRIYPGREDEDEVLIEGGLGGVEISTGLEEEEEDD